MKIRKLELIEDGALKYQDLIDLLLQGASSSDEILKAVRVTNEIEDALNAPGEPKILAIDSENYAFIISRIDKTAWNSPGDKATRKALAKFITTLRNLPEIDAKVSA